MHNSPNSTCFVRAHNAPQGHQASSFVVGKLNFCIFAGPKGGNGFKGTASGRDINYYTRIEGGYDL